MRTALAWLRYAWWRSLNDDIRSRDRAVVIRWQPNVNVARRLLVGYRFPSGRVRGAHPSRYW